MKFPSNTHAGVSCLNRGLQNGFYDRIELHSPLLMVGWIASGGLNLSIFYISSRSRKKNESEIAFRLIQD